MSARGADPGRVLTAGQIAAWAGVTPSAVSNWRKRHADFPAPTQEMPGSNLFARPEVEKWLQRHNKPYGLQVEGTGAGPGRQRAGMPDLTPQMQFWRRLTQGRLLAWLQLAYLRSAGNTVPDPTGGRWGPVWRTLLEDPEAGRRMWESVVQEEASSLGRDLARALMPARRVPVAEFLSAAQWVDQLRSPALGDVVIEYQQRHTKTGPALAEPALNTAFPAAAFAIELLSPLSGTFYDPAFGMGTMLAAGWLDREGDDLTVCGQEVSFFAWKVTFLRLLLHGAKPDLRTGDTLLDDRFGTLKADRIALHPPWGIRGDSDPLLPDDRWPFEHPPRSQEWLWIHHVLYHLAPGGRAVVIVPRPLMHRAGRDAEERHRVLASGVLDAVIDLPPGATAYGGVPATLLVFDRARGGREGGVLFVDARKKSTGRRGRPLEFGDPMRAGVVNVVREWRAGSLESEARFFASVTTDEIEEAGAVWDPSRFIRYAIPVTHIDGESLGRRLARLLGETDTPAGTLRRTADVFALLQTLDHSRPRSWPAVRLGEILSAQPRTGSRKNEKGEGISHPYVSPAFMRTGGGVIRDIPEDGTRGRAGGLRLTQPGDLLLTSRGIKESQAPACAVVRVEKPLAYSESLVRLRPSRMVDPDYLRLYLTSREAHQALVSKSSGATISNIRPKALEDLEIPLPDVEEQKRIVWAAVMAEDTVSELEALGERMRDLSVTLHEGLISGVFRAVRQHHDCTLPSRFKELKRAVKARTEATQQLLEPGSRHNFRFYDDADSRTGSIDFGVERTPLDPRPDASIFGQDVTFNLRGDHIRIVDHTTTPPKQLTVTVEWTDAGCRYVIGDERLMSDEVAFRVLEPFFGSEGATFGA